MLIRMCDLTLIEPCCGLGCVDLTHMETECTNQETETTVFLKQWFYNLNGVWWKNNSCKVSDCWAGVSSVFISSAVNKNISHSDQMGVWESHLCGNNFLTDWTAVKTHGGPVCVCGSGTAIPVGTGFCFGKRLCFGDHLSLCGHFRVSVRGHLD